jgi:hypothetical protein
MAGNPMNYLGQEQIVSFDTLKAMQKAKEQKAPFQFKKEYLPVVIAVIGVSSIFFVRNYMRKKRK